MLNSEANLFLISAIFLAVMASVGLTQILHQYK